MTMTHDHRSEKPGDRRRVLHRVESSPAGPYRAAILSTLALLAALILLSGCNTMRGFGEDVEATGEEVSETAEETEDELRN
jgi:predicted small secreted protein